MSLSALASMIEGDRIDARAMMAREVWAERCHRIYGFRPSLRALAALEAHGVMVRAYIEETNGEDLL